MIKSYISIIWAIVYGLYSYRIRLLSYSFLHIDDLIAWKYKGTTTLMDGRPSSYD